MQERLIHPPDSLTHFPKRAMLRCNATRRTITAGRDRECRIVIPELWPLTDFREATAKPFNPGASRRKFLKTLAMAGAGSALCGRGALAQAISPSVLPMRGRIDVHHHFFPPFYIEAMKDQLASSGFTLRQWSPAISLDMMDKHGIATAFVSPVQRLVMDSHERARRKRTQPRPEE